MTSLENLKVVFGSSSTTSVTQVLCHCSTVLCNVCFKLGKRGINYRLPLSCNKKRQKV